MKDTMKDNSLESIHQYFGELPDPWIKDRRAPGLVDSACIVVAAIVCGQNS